MTRYFSALLLLSLVGCAADQSSDARTAASLEQPLIYGEDDRQELYEVEDPELRALARSSVVALIEQERLLQSDAGTVSVVSSPLGASLGLCDAERFATQPVAANCTGVLIDGDLVVTGGHCVTDDVDCRRHAFVFDYAYREAGQLETIGTDDVYGCQRLVARSARETGADFAIVQLDRSASGRAPARVRKEPLSVGDRVVSIGLTSGLPVKVDLGAEVKDDRQQSGDFFLLDSDTFEGSSGSGIFDTDRALAGVLVRGGEDYVGTDAGCRVSRVLPVDAGAPAWNWEQATYAARAVEALCQKGYPSEALCPRKACEQACEEEACPEAGCEARADGGRDAAGDSVPEPARASASGCSVCVEPGSRGSSLRWLLVPSLTLVLRRASGAVPTARRAPSRR